ncbi:Fc.00g064410.m01.CDS01 [Cosmosporella sp. VM-42]
MVPIHKSRGFQRSVESHTSNSSMDRSTPPKSPKEPMTTMLIGPNQKRFKVNKRLLCDSSPFFSERLEGSPHSKPISLWLPGESATMFALFVEWVHQPDEFREYLADAVSKAHETSEQACQGIHWAILRLHLFASHLSLYELQDLAMDAVQDLYLRCDWDVPPTLITYLYTKCEALAAVRLRRWAVAMVAFSLTGNSNISFPSQDPETSDTPRFQHLFDTIPEFAADYAIHTRKLRASGLDARFKNPQLRIPANKLRNEERAFGFRECSFHSHRALVGERRCPHEVGRPKLTVQPPVEEWGTETEGTGLTAPSRRERDAVPRPLFSRDGDGDSVTEDAYAKALKHVRSISSTLKT